MTDLNTFFAKKDKKKSKGRKFTTINEIDKKFQEPSKNKEKSQRTEGDAEWKEFEEKTHDYTGLKIQNKTTEEEEEEEGDDETEDSQQKTDSNESTSNPWKILVQSQDNPTGKKVTIVQNEGSLGQHDCTETKPKVGMYVPPHLRNMKHRQLPGNRTGRTNKTVLDKNDDTIFPPLCTTMSKEIPSNKRNL